jgi:hypothetical protein
MYQYLVKSLFSFDTTRAHSCEICAKWRLLRKTTPLLVEDNTWGVVFYEKRGFQIYFHLYV